jgi:AcrR family transcriptional regulator
MPQEGESIWIRPERSARGRGQDRARALTRDEIVRAAIEIADAEGLEAASMRNIARKLNVGTMSLYWHIENRDQLWALMRDAYMGEIRMPEESSGDWRADLTLIANETRAAMKRHRWITSLFAGAPTFGPNMLRHADLSMAAVDGFGLEPQTMINITSVVDDYVLGFTLGELNEEDAHLRTGKTMQDWVDELMPYLHEQIASGKYPRVARWEPDDVRVPDRDTAFKFGLDCLLDGFAARIPGLSSDTAG